jgi:hypothetical protein
MRIDKHADKFIICCLGRALYWRLVGSDLLQPVLTGADGLISVDTDIIFRATRIFIADLASCTMCYKLPSIQCTQDYRTWVARSKAACKDHGNIGPLVVIAAQWPINRCSLVGTDKANLSHAYTMYETTCLDLLQVYKPLRAAARCRLMSLCWAERLPCRQQKSTPSCCRRKSCSL